MNCIMVFCKILSYGNLFLYCAMFCMWTIFIFLSLLDKFADGRITAIAAPPYVDDICLNAKSFESELIFSAKGNAMSLNSHFWDEKSLGMHVI